MELQTKTRETDTDNVAEVDLNMLLSGMLLLAIAGIAGAYSLSVIQSVKAGMACSNATAGYVYDAATDRCRFNATLSEPLSVEGIAAGNAQQGIANITAEFDLVGTIIVAVVILGLIFLLFQFVRA